MVKKIKKRKPKKPINESYMIEVNNWEVSYAFIGRRKRKLYNDLGGFGEHADLLIDGKVVYPEYKNVSKVKINIYTNPKLNYHWKQVSTDD